MTLQFITEIQADVTAIEAKIATWFATKAEPAVETAVSDTAAILAAWGKQFESDFGGEALAAAAVVVQGFATGGFGTVVQVAEAAGAALLAKGISTAEADAQTVLLNAARTALTAAQPALSPNATTGAAASSAEPAGGSETAAPTDVTA